MLNMMNNYVADRAYSRKLESEADAVGLEVCWDSTLSHLVVTFDLVYGKSWI
jgi:hypothetical protein